MVNTRTKPLIKNNTLVTRQDIANVVMSLLGFFLGRVTVLQFINPLAIPYVSSFLFQGRKFYFVCFFTFIGFITTFSNTYSLKYTACVSLLAAINFFLSKRISRSRQSMLLKAVISSVCIFISGMLLAYINSLSMYFIIIAVLEAILCFCMTYIVKRGVHIISTNEKNSYITNDDLISIAILLGGIVAGSADIYIANISLRYFFSSLIILIVSFKGGSAFSCMTGVLIGSILYILGWHDTSIIGIFAAAGISGGVFRKYGKVFTSVGFIFGGVIAVIYLDRNMLGTELFLSVLAANILSVLLPDKFYFNISSAINPPIDNTGEYIAKIREITVNRLNSFSASFRKLSKVFDTLAEKKTVLTQTDMSKLIDEVCAKTCVSCEMLDNCWEKNFYGTYQAVFGMIEACEKKGYTDTGDVTKPFASICVNLNKFIDCIGSVYERYKNDLVWHNRIIQSRSLVSEQLSGVSSVIENLSGELNFDLKFNEELEQEFTAELSKINIEVANMIVLENKAGKYEVSFNRKACTNRRSCTKDILPVANKVFFRKMAREDKECSSLDNCNIRLIEEQKYRVTSGVAKAVKNDGKISGDCHSFMELKNGQCYFALSDGMGTGKKAGEESAATLELLEEFLEAGFNKELAIRIINSILLLKSSEDSFSTLDLCSIDLYTGAAEFVKIGASNTYLFRDGNISVIKSSSLPVGILNTVDVEVTRKKLKDSDMVLMITDGVSDLSEDINEEWMANRIKTLRSKNPQDIADYILSEAKKKAPGTIKDDMTILVARIWEKI